MRLWILNNYYGNKNYAQVTLVKNGKRFLFLVHRLVATAFLKNPKNYPCVNHKDGNKAHNSINNLEWCSYSHNNQHARDTGLRQQAYGEDHPRAKLTEADVKKIRETYVRGVHSSGYGQQQLASDYGVSTTVIQHILSRKTWTHI